VRQWQRPGEEGTATLTHPWILATFFWILDTLVSASSPIESKRTDHVAKIQKKNKKI